MKKNRIMIIIWLSLSVLCIGSCYMLKFSWIGWNRIDSLEDLALDEEDFPPGWEVDYVIPIKSDWLNYGEQHISANISPKDGSGNATQMIFHFRNVFSAMWGYNIIRDKLVIVKENELTVTEYTSPIADKWSMTCFVTGKQVELCDVISRYEDIVVYFGITTERGQLSPEEYTKILKGIDDRIGRALNKTPAGE